MYLSINKGRENRYIWGCITRGIKLTPTPRMMETSIKESSTYTVAFWSVTHNLVTHINVWGKVINYIYLTFMGPCIVSIFYYVSNKMQRYTIYLYLETALHVSGGTSTHHQEHIQLYLQHLVFVRPLLLPAAIAAGSSNGLTNTRCCRYSCMCSWWWVEVPPETCRAVSRYK